MQLRRVVIGSTTVMYFSAALPRMLSWLLTAAIAVQPALGFSCGCGGATAGSAAQPTRQRSCCCTGAAQCRCGSMADGKPRRSCCQRRANPDSVPSGARVCHCASGVPASPQSIPVGRSHTDDLAASALYACAVTVDVLALHRDGWAINFPTEFASASDRCVSLCRLRF
jgi:hypothetical protein